MLGLRCPIRLLRPDRCSADDLRYATDALRESLVPRLKLSLLFSDGFRGLDELCSPALAAVHLTLQVVYPGTAGDEERDTIARDMAQLPRGPTFWYVRRIPLRMRIRRLVACNLL